MNTSRIMYYVLCTSKLSTLCTIDNNIMYNSIIYICIIVLDVNVSVSLTLTTSIQTFQVLDPSVLVWSMNPHDNPNQKNTSYAFTCAG